MTMALVAIDNVDGQHICKRAADIDADFPGAFIFVVHVTGP
jgi:hypothetical protein